MKNYVTSVCLGSDIICRSNVNSLAKLREDCLDCIARSKINKFTITKTIFKENIDINDILYKKGEEPNSLFKINVDKYKVFIFFIFCKFFIYYILYILNNNNRHIFKSNYIMD